MNSFAWGFVWGAIFSLIGSLSSFIAALILDEDREKKNKFK